MSVMLASFGTIMVLCIATQSHKQYLAHLNKPIRVFYLCYNYNMPSMQWLLCTLYVQAATKYLQERVQLYSYAMGYQSKLQIQMCIAFKNAMIRITYNMHS